MTPMPAELFSLILETQSNKQTLIRNTNLSQCAKHPFIYIYKTKIYRHDLQHRRFSSQNPHRSPSCRSGEVDHVGTWYKATPENHQSLPLEATEILLPKKCQKCCVVDLPEGSNHLASCFMNIIHTSISA